MPSGDHDDAARTTDRETASSPYRQPHAPELEKPARGADRRFVVALLTWAALLDILGSGTWGKVLVGGFVGLALMIYLLVRFARPVS